MRKILFCWKLPEVNYAGTELRKPSSYRKYHTHCQLKPTSLNGIASKLFMMKQPKWNATKQIRKIRKSRRAAKGKVQGKHMTRVGVKPRHQGAHFYQSNQLRPIALKLGGPDRARRVTIVSTLKARPAGNISLYFILGIFEREPTAREAVAYLRGNGMRSAWASPRETSSLLS